MPRSIPFRVLLAAGMLLTTGSAARADLTAFIGASRVTRPSAIVASDESDKEFRTTKGLAVGFSLVIVGFEVEWADTSGDKVACQNRAPLSDYCAPSLMTGMGNVLLQTPHGVTPVQVYGTVGAGIYREHFEQSSAGSLENDYGVGTNVGGGVKIHLAGPLRLRIDYRIFKLANDAFNKTPQRFYAGANIAF